MSRPEQLRDRISRHRLIVSRLIDHAPTTRSHLVGLVEATQPTVTRWIGDLIEGGLVTELGAAGEPDRPGRPSILIDLVADAAYVGALHLCRDFAEVGCLNLKGEVVFKHTLRRAAVDRAAAIEVAEEAVERFFQLIDEWDIPHDRLLGLGVAASGIVDPDRGDEFRYTFADGRPVETAIPIKDALERAAAVPVCVSTNAWTMALGERWFGNKETDFVLVWVNEGVGSAVVIDGRLHTGRGAAGEIGHIKVAGDEWMCDCGRQGCLAAVVSSHKVLERYGGAKDDIWDLVRAANHGEPAAQALIETCAEAIGAACVPLVDLLDPDAIVLAGPLVSNPDLIAGVDRHIHHNAFLGRLRGVRVLPTLLGRDVALVGAASLIFNSLLGEKGVPLCRTPSERR